jgi:UDP-N-acetylglucosamine--N-acetylmuramyl-(pentapeptide) pyrophosphoryl-undecaprenol N-acetylglucosamine transferase
MKLIFLFLKTKPKFFIGAGGYVCGPALLAGWMLRKPIFIIEQNATAGLTNKLLAKISNKVFVHFENTRGLEHNTKLVLAGNPIRKDIRFSEQNFEKDTIKVLAYGGSLGANQINKSLYKYVPKKNQKVHIHHQVGKNNINLEVEAENYSQLEYISDMQSEYDWANIIVARSGASTVAELRVVGKPCILIPFPGHSDHHQVYNAEELKKDASFPVMILDSMKTTKELSKQLQAIIENFEFSQKKLERTNIVDSFAIIDKEIQKCME